MRILSIVGARPQFIKAVMFSQAVLDAQGRGNDIHECLVHTGQHFDLNMSDVFFRELSIPEPVANLDIHGGSHAQMTGQMLPAIESQILKHKPDVLVVYGDTNSTLAGALAAAKLHVPIAHIEAGMRHYRRDIPEEVNRVVTDHVCDYLFCSSDYSRKCLAREGITEGVHVVGDITLDIFCRCEAHAVSPDIDEPFVACTIHRAANTDSGERLSDICRALRDCPFRIVLPLHPRTRGALDRHGLSLPENVDVREPVGYHEMIGLVRASQFVITDSGGLQKDAYFCGKRVITLSEVSPWQELIDLDADRLVGADPEAIVEAYQWARHPLPPSPNPYGDGTAAQRTVALLLEHLTAAAQAEPTEQACRS